MIQALRAGGYSQPAPSVKDVATVRKDSVLLRKDRGGRGPRKSAVGMDADTAAASEIIVQRSSRTLLMALQAAARKSLQHAHSQVGTGADSEPDANAVVDAAVAPPPPPVVTASAPLSGVVVRDAFATSGGGSSSSARAAAVRMMLRKQSKPVEVATLNPAMLAKRAAAAAAATMSPSLSNIFSASDSAGSGSGAVGAVRNATVVDAAHDRDGPSFDDASACTTPTVVARLLALPPSPAQLSQATAVVSPVATMNPLLGASRASRIRAAVSSPSPTIASTDGDVTGGARVDAPAAASSCLPVSARDPSPPASPAARRRVVIARKPAPPPQDGAAAPVRVAFSGPGAASDSDATSVALRSAKEVRRAQAFVKPPPPPPE